MNSNELKNLNTELKECFLNAGKRAMPLRLNFNFNNFPVCISVTNKIDRKVIQCVKDNENGRET